MIGGIDAHKKETVLCIVGSKGKRETLVRAPTTPEGLDRLVELTLPLEAVVVEASTSGKAVARYLRDRGVKIDLIHADTLLGAVRRTKSDPVDAEDLARIAMHGAYKTAYLPTREEEEQRALVVRAVNIRERLTQLTCQIKAMAQANLLSEPVGKLDTLACRRRWEALTLPTAQKAMLKSRLQEYEFLHHELQTVRLSTIEAVSDHPGVSILQTIPGANVGFVAGILAFTGDFKRFPEASKYASSTGLTPKKNESGDKDRGGRITKKGHSILRSLYVEIAWQVIRHPGQLRNQYLRLQARKGRKKAIVAIARKLAVIVWHMVTRQEPYKFAIERLTEIKKWRLRATRTLLNEGKRQEAARLLRSHDPYREREKWTRERAPVTT